MRHTKYSIVIVMIALFVFSISMVYADEPEKIEKVIVSGIGIDMDKAKQNAIRNAVEQIIGSYISSDTIVQNSTVLKDEVLSYSGGYVKDMKILSQEKNDDSLYSVKIEANVISTKLKRKLESLNIATKKIEGESLFGEAVSKIENQTAGQELLNKILSKYPQAAYMFEIGKPQILSTDPGTGRAKVKIPLSIQWNQAFLSELKEVLSKVATVELKSADIVSFNNGANMKYRNGNKIVCFAEKRTIRSGRANSCEIIGILGEEDKSYKRTSGKAAKTSKKKLSLMSLIRGDDDASVNPGGGTRVEFSAKSILNLKGVSAEKMSLSLKFKDKSGADIDAATYTFNRYDSDSPNKQEILFDRDSKSGNLRSALKGDWGFSPPNTLWHDSKGSNLLILTDGVYKMNPEVSVDVSILKDITKIEVHMNSWRE
ncbi:MAG: hypothetical protein AB2L12_04580 [Smithellaceae bacterium]